MPLTYTTHASHRMLGRLVPQSLVEATVILGHFVTQPQGTRKYKAVFSGGGINYTVTVITNPAGTEVRTTWYEITF